MVVAGGNRKTAHLDPGCRVFLLRCWKEAGAGQGEEPAWRFALARPSEEGTPRGFASLEDLVAYLRGELAAAD